MGIITIDGLQCNMVLASDVKDRLGRVLLQAGQEIQEKHLRIFKMWGVTEADVRGVEAEDVAKRKAMAVDPVRLKQAEERARVLFQRANTENAFIKELLRLVVLHAVNQPEGASANKN